MNSKLSWSGHMQNKILEGNIISCSLSLSCWSEAPKRLTSVSSRKKKKTTVNDKQKKTKPRCQLLMWKKANILYLRSSIPNKITLFCIVFGCVFALLYEYCAFGKHTIRYTIPKKCYLFSTSQCPTPGHQAVCLCAVHQAFSCHPPLRERERSKVYCWALLYWLPGPNMKQMWKGRSPYN